jgi:hypothetical protein
MGHIASPNRCSSKLAGYAIVEGATGAEEERERRLLDKVLDLFTWRQTRRSRPVERVSKALKWPKQEGRIARWK